MLDNRYGIDSPFASANGAFRFVRAKVFDNEEAVCDVVYMELSNREG